MAVKNFRKFPSSAATPLRRGVCSRYNLPMRLALLISLCVLFAAGCSRVSPAEVVIRNGTIYTASPNLPKAEAIAVNGGEIVFVGSNSDVAAYVGGNTKVIDLAGNTAVPGFTDSHYHLSGVGARERTLNLESTKKT